jgi:hypothetical protein
MRSLPSQYSMLNTPFMLHWLNRYHLTLPAWVLAESMRPLAWLAGQAALVGSPLAGMMGLSQWEAWAETLNDPERYDALCTMLAEQVEMNQKGNL